MRIRVGALLSALLLYSAVESSGAPAIETFAVYSGDAWANVGEGGIDKGERFLSNLLVGASIPLGEDAEVDSGKSRLYLSALHNTGEFISGDLVGDTQLVSNIEANRATRIFEANYEYQSADGRSAWLVGLWDLNAEIDVIEPAGLFLNSSQGIGAEFGTSGRNGPSIFPITSLALRWRQTISDRLTLRAAILDGVPGNPNAPDRPRAAFQLGSGDGALLSAEAAYTLNANWTSKLGAWRYTTPRPLRAGQSAENDPENAATGFAQGVYASLSGDLYRGSDAGTVSTFARVGIANGDVQQIASYAGAGIVWSDFAPSLNDEQLGLAIAHARTARASRQLGDLEHETAVELTFSTQLTPWLRLQPNVQYVFNPGLNAGLDDTLVLGLRLELAGSYRFF